ncbi:MAG: PhnD/SsuA/transferrin family substrate-binding protein [Pseudomonadota bacterium]
MIAYLGFYDMAPVQAANDLYWSKIRDALGAGPAHLERPDDLWPIWTAPDLVLAQTCSLPYRARLHGQVRLVGTPDFGLPDCPPGRYRSVIVMRNEGHWRSDLRLAVNDPLSQSGWAALQTVLSERGLQTGPVTLTGSHAASLQAVAEGAADLAGIDLLSWLMFEDLNLTPRGLREVDLSPITLGPPYITSASQDPAPLADAVRQAITALPDETRRALHLKGFVRPDEDAYVAEPMPPRLAL